MSPLRNAPDYGETQAFDDKELDGQNGGYLPFYKTAMEFPSEEAYKKYEEEHPGLDKSLHWIKDEEKNKSEGISFSEELTGHHHGQSDLKLSLRDKDKTLGTVFYSEYQGRPHIQFIDVKEKRKGVGKALLKKLQQKYPETEIELGMLTEEGSKLVDSLNFLTISDKVLIGKLEALKHKREQLAKIDAILSEETEKGEINRELWGKRDDLDREIWELEGDLRDVKVEQRIII